MTRDMPRFIAQSVKNSLTGVRGKHDIAAGLKMQSSTGGRNMVSRQSVIREVVSATVATGAADHPALIPQPTGAVLAGDTPQ